MKNFRFHYRTICTSKSIPKHKIVHLFKGFSTSSSSIPLSSSTPPTLHQSSEYRTRCTVSRPAVLDGASSGRVLPTTQSHFPLCCASIPYYGQYLFLLQLNKARMHTCAHTQTVWVDGRPPGGARCCSGGEGSVCLVFCVKVIQVCMMCVCFRGIKGTPPESTLKSQAGKVGTLL